MTMRAKYDSIPDNTESSSSPYDSDVSRSTVATPCPSDSNSVATPHQMENATPNSHLTSFADGVGSDEVLVFCPSTSAHTFHTYLEELT